MDTRKIYPSDLHTTLDMTTQVISAAQKFIIPVPHFRDGGEPLVYPESDPKAGQLFEDSAGNILTESGIVFFNFKDQCYQAAVGDGTNVIIINEVTVGEADILQEAIGKLQADPHLLSLPELKKILTFVHEDLHLADIYNATRSYVSANLTPVIDPQLTKQTTSDPEYGLKKRDDQAAHKAIYIPGKFVFEGPAASPQRFENGGIVVVQNGEMRGVQPEIFMRTYLLADGSPIRSVDNIKAQMN